MRIDHAILPRPLRRASSQNPFGGAPAPNGKNETQKSLEGRRILVIEDEGLIALLLTDALEEAGATVVGPCYTLAECLKVIESEDFDAAIVDVDLAGHDVFPAAEMIRQRNIPFLFHTAHGERAELQSRFADAPVCRKPTSMKDLLEVLSRISGSQATN